MRSKPTGSGEPILSSQYNSNRDDARGGSFLLAHQQLGAIALPTNPTNGQTLTVTVNGAAIVITYVSTLGSTPNNVVIQGTAALTAAATVNFLRRPDITTTTQVAATGPNQQLLQYLGWALPASGTTITPYSLNKNVNGASTPLTTFTASTTVTGASWTAQAMQLYIEDGTYYIGTTRVLFLGGSTPTFTAPVSNPRIDLVTADSTGTIATVTGTEAATPAAPAYPVNKIVIAEVYHVVGETALYDNENQQSGQGYVLNDVRVFLTPTYIASQAQIAPSAMGGTTPAEGDLLYFNGTAWVDLAAGSSGQFLQTQGASAIPKWASASFPNANGTSSYSGSSGTQTIAHGLGKTPSLVRFMAGFNAAAYGFSIGSYNGTGMVCMAGGSSTPIVGIVTSYVINVVNSGNGYYATVTFDATNIYLAWTKIGTGGQVNFSWEAM